jgi:hypothetical protein
MASKKNLKCERCEKLCTARLPDPLVEVDRFDGFGKLVGKSAQLICLKCVDKARKLAGYKPPPTKQAIKRADAAKNLLVFGGAYNERSAKGAK